MNWNGNRAMVLTREFERANPFEEIFPPRLTDVLGHDVLQNTLQICAGNYAEEWPMAAEPIHEEVQS